MTHSPERSAGPARTDDPIDAVLAAAAAARPGPPRRKRRISRTLVLEMPGRRLRIGHATHDPLTVVTSAEAAYA